MARNVLIIEDEQQFACNVATYLLRHGYETQVATNGVDGLRLFEEFKPDLVLLDFLLGSMDGLSVLRSINDSSHQTNVVFMTGHGSVDVAVDAMKTGAVDFVTKPVSLARLRRIVERIAPANCADIASAPPADDPSQPALIGDSAAIRVLRSRITHVSNAVRRTQRSNPPSVLVTGATGTGKEIVANLLHKEGLSSESVFISVNCAAIPSHLVEAELFGYERGAFTDAKQAKAGLVEAANGGMLFLDEVGDLDLSVQSKLLRMLEQRTVRRIGAVVDRDVNCWVVSATNRPLETLVATGAFRADLMYRLKVLHLELPTLSERGDDVVLIAQYLLTRICKQWDRLPLKYSVSALDRLRSHSWPGNVRELRNIVEQAVLLCDGPLVEDEHLLITAGVAATSTQDHSSIVLPDNGVILDDVERSLIEQALVRCNWNVTAAAQSLGLTRDTLRYRIDKHHIKRTS